MKPIAEWKNELRTVALKPETQTVSGRNGKPTLKIANIFLHSKYNPEEEAQRLVDSAKLDQSRPVLVIGLGLGYHVAELLRRGYECAVTEPDSGVARLAVEQAIVGDEVLLAIESPEEMMACEEFQRFAARLPQTFVHPPTAHLYPEYAAAVQNALFKASLSRQRLSIAVVGPLYGGSLPITDYLVNAFRRLGHNTLLVDNREAWGLYQSITGSVQTPSASAQLGQLLTNALSEWAYARVAEFAPEICLVMAQAPVGPQFPVRLSKSGIITAFWYVENWRHLPYWRDIAPMYDVFFHIQPGEFEQKLDEIGCRCHAFVQTGCDPEVHRPMVLTAAEQEEYACDLSFAGAGYYNRRQLFKGLTDYQFKIWGVDWPDRELSRLVVGGERRFFFDDFMRIVAGSKINLNLHSSTAHEGVDPKCDAINPRVFEIAAAGGFQLCDPCLGLERHFDFETELPVYRDLKELRSRIDYFLAHPGERNAFAERARRRALREHTYEHRAQQMLDFIFQRHGAHLLRRGIRVQRTAHEMAERLEAGSALGEWLSTLPADTLFTQESIDKCIQPAGEGRSYPEKVFCYMKEVREFAESMLKEHR